MEINQDGSIQGKTFSGENYKGEFPSPKYGDETYKEFYERVQECKKNGFHLGDLSFDDYTVYCYGSPPGGGAYIQNYVIGEEPEEDYIEEVSECCHCGGDERYCWC